MCVDTFGLRMMYPGVVLQNLISERNSLNFTVHGYVNFTHFYLKKSDC